MNWNWRTTLGVVLFAAAVISGWSAWKQRARPAAAAVQESGADYILRDFELIALDKQSGKESMTLRAPEMHRNRADQTADITTPVFLMPDNANLPWTLRSKTAGSTRTAPNCACAAMSRATARPAAPPRQPRSAPKAWTCSRNRTSPRPTHQ